MDRLSSMKLFVRTVEVGSFSAVADEMSLTQSSVSKRIAALERELNVKLFNRNTRRLVLTDVGKAYYERCVHILAALADAEFNISRLQSDPVGSLRVNSPICFGRLYVVKHALAFIAEYPMVKIELTMSDNFIDLLEEGADLAIRLGRLKDSRLASTPMGKCPQAVVATPRYFEKHGKPEAPQDLVDHNCLHYTNWAMGNKWRFDGPHGTDYVRVSGNFSTNNCETLREVALSGIGVVILPRWLIGQDLRNGLLETALDKYALPALDLNAVYPSARYLPAKVRLFIKYLSGQLRMDLREDLIFPKEKGSA